MATAINSAKSTGLSARQSQWAIIVRQFCKRRLAVASTFMVLFLVTVSIFAPLLANDRPIYYVGTNRFEFREAAKNARAIVVQLVTSANAAPARWAEQTRTLQRQFDLMLGELSGEASTPVQELRTNIHAAVAKPDRAQAITDLRALQKELRAILDAAETHLTVRPHWPVLKSLQWADLGFMTAILLLLTLPLWHRWAISQKDGNSRSALLIFILAPSCIATAWWMLIPVRVDRTAYKAGVLVADAGAAKAGVVYQSVMWPPIAYGIDEYDLAKMSAPPAWYPENWKPKTSRKVSELTKAVSPWNTPHWMGTDADGRDILCRMIWGGRVSLSVGIVAVAIYVSIGIVVGALAGYFRGLTDLLISRIIEVVICFPSFFLILTIVAMVGPGLLNIMVVIGLTGWTGIARLVRGEFLRLVDQEFVLAGRALGYSPLRLIFRHVLPNAMAPVMVSATFGIAGAILTESALSFLGLGIQAPIPSWGSLLSDGRSVMNHAPWLIHFPGLAIFITITSYNLIGESLRDAADPRLRGSR
ncbi:MAG: binding-protein-dependent transport system inner rane component [Schlesneria sp.]|nr:binding-protein-dependent transport system inner rane component [Schlesneria sp.]